MSDYITAEEIVRLVRMMPLQEHARPKEILQGVCRKQAFADV